MRSGPKKMAGRQGSHRYEVESSDLQMPDHMAVVRATAMSAPLARAATRCGAGSLYHINRAIRRFRANVNAIWYATIIIACYKMRGQTVCGLEWRCQSAICISRERLATCLQVSLPGIGSVSFGNDRRLFAAPSRGHGNDF